MQKIRAKEIKHKNVLLPSETKNTLLHMALLTKFVDKIIFGSNKGYLIAHDHCLQSLLSRQVLIREF